MTKKWNHKKEEFRIMDVRQAKGNFLPNLLKTCRSLKVGDGICIVQTFEPVPLYSALAELGFEHETERISDREYRVWFCRTQGGTSLYDKTGDTPLKPTAILNFKKVDQDLASRVVDFWQLIWGKENPAIDMKTKLLLSLTNGVGAGRFRQATRELIKTYALGTTVEELDEVFSLMAWNGGIGTFASEIGPSPLFGAYQLIKDMENRGFDRLTVVTKLTETYGESNPQVSVAGGVEGA